MIEAEVLDYDPAFIGRCVPLMAEFFGVAEVDVRAAVKSETLNPGSTVAAAWQTANPLSPAEINRFYSETSSYVYDLVVDHCRPRRREVQDVVLARIERLGPARNVLLYGDGIGTDSIAIATRGHRVTYFDLPGLTSAFARFRFERERPELPITVVEKESAIADEAFDAAVCIEVLEHVPDPPGVMRTLHRSLRYRGIALITESFESIGDEFPSHLPANFQYAGRTHQIMEGLGFASTYYNTNPINRPMEFTKVRPDFAGKSLRLRGKLRRIVSTRLRRLLVPQS